MQQMLAISPDLLRKHIKQQVATLPDTHAWLIGTQGCHLCDEAYQQYQLAQRVAPLPDVLVLDVIEFAPSTLTTAISHAIPILVLPNRILCYPFGLMDIVQL